MMNDIIILENLRFRPSVENDKPALSKISTLESVFEKKAFSVTVNNVWTVSQSRRENLHFQSKTNTDRIGRYSYDDGDGSENITLKMNSHFFKLCRVYSNLLKISNAGEFPCSWFIGDRT